MELEQTKLVVIDCSGRSTRMQELKSQLREMAMDLQSLREGYDILKDRVDVLNDNSRRIPTRRTRNLRNSA